MTITVDEMRGKLHPLDHVRTVLARSEPLEAVNFTVGDAVRFTVDAGWNHGIETVSGDEAVGAFIHIGRGASVREVQLSKDALLESTSAIGMNQSYAERQPASLIERPLNYWFREGLAARAKANQDYQLLVAGGIGAAVTRASIVPFSNLRLLDQVLDGIAERWGSDAEVLADYKLTHNLRRSHLRLIVPGQRRTITGTGTDDADEWSVGFQIKNSIIGREQTAVDGYLFRWLCTNGQTTNHPGIGTWTRKAGASDTAVYEWARSAVDEILGGLEHALDAVQETVNIPIAGHASEVLRDVFDRYRTPSAERNKIIDNMVEAEQLTMYSVMNAITEVANTAGMHPGHVDALLRMGGDLPRAAHARCGECYRLLPD